MPINRLVVQKTLLFGLIATSMYAGNSFSRPPTKQEKSNTLYSTLDYYGFKSPQQKEQLLFLMQQAGVENAKELLYKQTTNNDQLIEQIILFVQETQARFTIRTGAQERWHVKTANWMQDPTKQEQMLFALKTLQMLDAVAPKLTHPDIVCVLGARNSIMQVRLDFAGKLLNQGTLKTKQIIMLAGERYVTFDANGVSIDGTPDELAELAQILNKNVVQITETDLMRKAYKNSILYGKYPAEIIDTPRGDLPRPTTETTVAELSAWIKKHPEFKSIEFISNQPHVTYQDAIIYQVFKKYNVNVKFETIGAEINPKLKDEAKIKDATGALGSFIYAKTPAVLYAIGLQITDPEARKKLRDIYEKQPLIYHNLEGLFATTSAPTLKPS